MADWIKAVLVFAKFILGIALLCRLAWFYVGG